MSAEKSKLAMRDAVGEELYQVCHGEENNAEKKDAFTVKPYVLGKKRSLEDDSLISTKRKHNDAGVERISLDVTNHCNNCSKVFKQHKRLLQHKTQCKENVVCKDKFSIFDSLTEHQLNHCNNATKPSTLKLKWDGNTWKIDDDH